MANVGEKMRALLLAAILLCGCSTWRVDEAPTTPRLPQTQMSRNSVGLEVATVTLDADNYHLLDEIIHSLDEQVMDATVRRHLADNGFRGGLIGTQLPTAIQLLLLEAADRRERPTAETFRELPDQQRFVQCRSGKRVDVPLWGTIPVADIKHNDGELTVTDTLQAAACKLGLVSEPAEDNGARITLKPYIEHGNLRQQYVVDGGAFHMEAGREEVAYDDLEMEFSLQSGETLLITCTEDKAMLGQTFFRNADGTKQKLMLVRLAQTQIDMSFDQ